MRFMCALNECECDRVGSTDVLWLTIYSDESRTEDLEQLR